MAVDLCTCRYTHLHGKHVVHPLDGRKIPIITDAELVDMSFGTGAVKLTPAHDPNDFATGKRHGLQFLNILTNEGNINAAGGHFAGQPRFKVCPPSCLSRVSYSPYHGHLVDDRGYIRCQGISDDETIVA